MKLDALNSAAFAPGSQASSSAAPPFGFPSTPAEPLFPELGIDMTGDSAFTFPISPAYDSVEEDFDYDAAARQLLEQSGFREMPVAAAPTPPQPLQLDIDAILEANRRKPAPGTVRLASGSSVIPPQHPSWSSRPMVGEQRAHGQRHKELVMPKVVSGRTAASNSFGAVSATSPLSADPLPSLSIERMNAESAALVAQLISGIAATRPNSTTPPQPPMFAFPSPGGANAQELFMAPPTPTLDPHVFSSDFVGMEDSSNPGIVPAVAPIQDYRMPDRPHSPSEPEEDSDAEEFSEEEDVDVKPDPDFLQAPTRRTRAASKPPTRARSKSTTKKPARSRSAQPKARSGSFAQAAEDGSDGFDEELRNTQALLSSSHQHRGAPPHASNQPIGATEDLQAKLDEDDRVLEAGGKGMSAKERRQIRNKISARNFRARRKEVGCISCLLFVWHLLTLSLRLLAVCRLAGRSAASSFFFALPFTRIVSPPSPTSRERHFERTARLRFLRWRCHATCRGNGRAARGTGQNGRSAGRDWSRRSRNCREKRQGVKESCQGT